MKYRNLQEGLDRTDEILQQLTFLDQARTEKELDERTKELLKLLCRYTKSERAYVFDYLPETRQYHRTISWYEKESDKPAKVAQLIDAEQISYLQEQFQNRKMALIEDFSKNEVLKKSEREYYALLNIRTMIVVPILINQSFSGFIGLTNPDTGKEDISMVLLMAIAGHLGSLRYNMKYRKELEDALVIANLNNEIISAISKLYWLIYRMDLDTDTYEEISSQEEMHRLTGKTGKISISFQDARTQVVAPEYQTFMKNFLDTSTLSERMKEKDTIATEYRSTAGNWHMARFIVKKRDKNQRVTNVLYVVREINEQKQQEFEYKEKLLKAAEEAKRANIAKTDFLRRMSHDIRTPINGIQGMISIAEHFSDDIQKQKECREKVKTASDFLLQLVNDVLDMNKLESGEITLEQIPFHLHDVLSSVANILQMQCEEQGLTLTIDNSGVIHDDFIGSPIHLQQILQNITSNAVKYNKENGSVSLSCKELMTEDEKVYFKIVCTDTGIGMSENFKNHAFEPFSQEKQSARTVYSGTGLGLAICRELAEKMGGTIRFYTKLHHGTTFELILPLQIDKEANKNKRQVKVENLDFSLEGKHVLLAEDNEINMEIAKFILEEKGMSVTHVWNGKEAVEEYQRSECGTYDLILMDIMMPVMGGLEATSEIRKSKKKDAKCIPIFAMSANAFADDKIRSIEAGMNGHFSKPLDAEKFIQTMIEYLKAL